MIYDFLTSLQVKERGSSQKLKINRIGPFLNKEILEFWLLIVGNLDQVEYVSAMYGMLHKYNKEFHQIFDEVKKKTKLTIWETDVVLPLKDQSEPKQVIEDTQNKLIDIAFDLILKKDCSIDIAWEKRSIMTASIIILIVQSHLSNILFQILKIRR